MSTRLAAHPSSAPLSGGCFTLRERGSALNTVCVGRPARTSLLEVALGETPRQSPLFPSAAVERTRARCTSLPTVSIPSLNGMYPWHPGAVEPLVSP